MPYLCFASNFLWVMILGLFGPSLPAIIRDLDISYARAGLFFTFFSLGSLFGTTLGGIATDYVNRKFLYTGVAVLLVCGLVCIGFAPSYLLILLIIFLLSLFGSPLGSIGQSIMLDMFPEKRESYLTIMTFFAASGSFLAPLLVSLNYTAHLSWRWPFMETACLIALLSIFIILTKIPTARAKSVRRKNFLEVLRNPKVLISSILIFFLMATDVGFPYWLAEYFKSELNVSIKLSSAVISIFLAGVISVRLLITPLLKIRKPKDILKTGLLLAMASLAVFLTISTVSVKVAAVFFFGFGIGPVFPLLMARGTAAFPDQPGTVTGVLFAFLSLGGIIFPLLLGILASRFGLAQIYLFHGVIVLGLFITESTLSRK